MANLNIPPPNTPLIMADGRIANEWYRYFVSLNTTADGAAAGTVETAPGSGLSGGGAVSDGISLTVTPNGISNSMLRQSAGTSVIGRAASSSGNVADISANLNKSVLQRNGNQLFFSTSLELAGTLECGALSVDTTATAASATQSHYIPVDIGGVTFKLLLAS